MLKNLTKQFWGLVEQIAGRAGEPLTYSEALDRLENIKLATNHNQKLHHLADLSPQILASASFLTRKPPVDPADQIMIATARVMDLTLIIRDHAIIDYGKEGWVRVLACRTEER